MQGRRFVVDSCWMQWQAAQACTYEAGCRGLPCPHRMDPMNGSRQLAFVSMRLEIGSSLAAATCRAARLSDRQCCRACTLRGGSGEGSRAHVDAAARHGPCCRPAAARRPGSLQEWPQPQGAQLQRAILPRTRPRAPSRPRAFQSCQQLEAFNEFPEMLSSPTNQLLLTFTNVTWSRMLTEISGNPSHPEM